MAKLKAKVSKLEGERDSLKQQLSSTGQSMPPAPEGAKPASVAPPGSDVGESLVDEERLKWQVEVVKVRRDLEGQLEKEKEARKEEGDALRREVQRLEEELAKGKPLRGQLEKSQQRLES